MTRAFVCSLALSACARPTLAFPEPDAEVDARVSDDAGHPPAHDAAEPDVWEPEPAEDASQSDASTDAAEPARDGGACSDGDGDTICDSADNCPTHANTGQEDGDGDGVGDACESDAGSPSACAAESVPATVTAGDAELSNVRVNGVSSPVSVRRGQRLSVTLSYVFSECALPLPGQPRFMTIGLEGQNSGDCQILVEVPCPAPANSSVTLSLDAPATSGAAYVVALGRQGFVCSDSLNNARRVAALCVE